MRDRKMQDEKMFRWCQWCQVWGTENAVLGNAGPKNAGLENAGPRIHIMNSTSTHA